MVLKRAMRVFSNSREEKEAQATEDKTEVPERGRLRNRFDFDLHFGPSTGSSSIPHMPLSASTNALPSQRSNLLNDDPANHKSQSNSPIKAALNGTPKEKRRPQPLNLQDALKYGEMASRRKGIEAVHDPIVSAKAQCRKVNDDGSSSVYMDKTPLTSGPSISPLKIMKRSEVDKINRILRAEKVFPLKEEDEAVTPWPSPTAPSPAVPLATLPSSVYDGAQEMLLPSPEPDVVPAFAGAEQPSAPLTHGFVKSATTNDILPSATVATTPFTPLSAWMVDFDGYTRKVSKNLFGDHGWLQDTAAALKKPEPPKPAGFLQGIKTFARGIAEKASQHHTNGRSRAPQRIYVSLEPREQSLLYREIEFVLSNALDSYINVQLHGGRLDPGKLKKISDTWRSKGRPRVVGFRYDLETQLDLVILHIRQFRFYGPLGRPAHISSSAINDDHHPDDIDDRVAVSGLLGAMVTNARQMRVRTLCLPDPVIAKHILDSQALLQLLGVPDSLQIAVAECSQFFKVIVERQRDKRAQEARRAEMMRENELQQSILRDRESSFAALIGVTGSE